MMKGRTLFLFLFLSRVVFSYLSFDSKHFLCDQFTPLCYNLLDQIGCSVKSSDRVVMGCPDWPTVPNNIANFNGTCTCLSPMDYDVAGKIIIQELIDNRVHKDLSWSLEPWDSGPPYDVKLSYKNICYRLLSKLGCGKSDQIVYARDTKISPELGSNFKCSCGNMEVGDEAIHTLIIDKINDYNLRAMPVFAQPTYLDVPLSICIILICGKIGAIIAVYFKLPSIIGFLLTGLGIQNILNPMFLKGAGFPFPSPAAELKKIALVIVLMRAGLSINFAEIIQNASATTALSVIPYLAEFFILLYYGAKLLGWTIIETGLFASIMAPLGPSVVISSLLSIIANKKKNHGYVPKQILMATPIEAVIAIIIFGVFATMAQTEKSTIYPWVELYPLYANCLLIPLNIMFSTILGIFTGYVVSKYINYRIEIKTDFIWTRINKNVQMGSSTSDLVFVLLVSCYTMMSLCVTQYIQQSSGVLVVFVTCITVSRLTDPAVCVDIAQGLKGIWLFAEIFLFTLTGTSLSFDATNGPLYGQRGLSTELVKMFMGLIFIGTCGRIVGLGVSLLLIYNTLPKHRRELRWISRFYLNCWIYQLPKATVQATLGSVALYQHIIPGPSGVNKGLIIAQSTAFTVLIFAPIGTILTSYVGAPLSLYLEKLDKEAGWKSSLGRYQSSGSITEGADSGGKGSGKEEDEDEDDYDENEDIYVYDYEDSNDKAMKRVPEERQSIESHDTIPHNVHFSFVEEKGDSYKIRNRNNSHPNTNPHSNYCDPPSPNSNRHNSNPNTPSPDYCFSNNSNPSPPSHLDSPNNHNYPHNPNPNHSSPESPSHRKTRKNSYVTYKSHQNIHALRDPDTIDGAFRRARTYSTDVMTYFSRSSKNFEEEEKERGRRVSAANENFNAMDINYRVDTSNPNPCTDPDANSNLESNINPQPNPITHPNPNTENVTRPSSEVDASQPTTNSSNNQNINSKHL